MVKRLHLDGSYIRSWLILAIDLAVSATATLVAFLGIDYFVRNSGFSLLHYLFLLVSAFFCSAVAFYIFRTYRTVIRHSSLREVWKLGAATLLKELLMLLILWFWPDGMTFKAIGLCVVLDLFVTVCMLITVRVLMILLYDAIILSHIRRTNRIRTLVYGVESKEVALVMRLQNSPHYDMCGFITYGRRLKYYEIAERPVYYFETEENIEYVLDKFGIEAILFGNYANAKAESDRLIKYCVTHGVKVLIAPPIDEIVDGKLAHQGGIRDIKIEDLLGREEIKISLGEIMDNFRDKTVLVTGAAGSIGSELCRQLATFGIRQLILFDNAETPMHEIRLEMEDRFPDLKFVPVIGDVRIPKRLDYVFRTYRPQVVFHAAAYKHVPLMEENPCEAVLVNVVGSRNVADRCIRYGVEKMVMISTDKAVNPTNVMGCTKRLAEIYVQSLGQAIVSGRIEGRTQFITTRFGNVLGSNGSVIPPFPRADRTRRPRDGDASRDPALLHDDSRGVPAGDGGRDDRPRQYDLRLRYGRVRQDRRTGSADDCTGGFPGRSGHPDRLHGTASGRETLRRGAEQYGKYPADRTREDPHRQGARIRLRGGVPRRRGAGTAGARVRYSERRAADETHRSGVSFAELPLRGIRPGTGRGENSLTET